MHTKGARTLYELHEPDGMEAEEIAQQYPRITAEDVKTAVEYMKEKK